MAPFVSVCARSLLLLLFHTVCSWWAWHLLSVTKEFQPLGGHVPAAFEVGDGCAKPRVNASEADHLNALVDAGSLENPGFRYLR